MLPASMLAMSVDVASHTLVPQRKVLPQIGSRDILVKVMACGVCRTDLHVIDAELPPHHPAIVPGHEVVGEVVACGIGAKRFSIGDRIGMPWLGRTCGNCEYCASGCENLCDTPSFTGYDRDGGYAEYAAADEQFCFPLPSSYDNAHAAPLLCAGLIGYRTWRLAGGKAPHRIGLWGFGAAAHLVCQLAVAHGQEVHAFTRPGDTYAQQFARSLGAAWSGGCNDTPSRLMDAQLIFAPDGALVLQALAGVRKGGVVVCGGIHMSKIPAFSYSLLWGERQIRSVANLTRKDGEEFFAMLTHVHLSTHVQLFPLGRANDAIQALRSGSLTGAAVLVP